jgi:IS30 family transposase
MEADAAHAALVTNLTAPWQRDLDETTHRDSTRPRRVLDWDTPHDRHAPLVAAGGS